MEDLILDPARLADLPPDKLLEAAAAGYLGIDHRFLHAMVDRPEASIPALVHFAAQDHEEDPVELNDVLIDVFRHLRAPEGVPFLIDLVRRAPLDIQDDLVEAMVQFGPAAVDPLLALLAELEDAGDDPGDVPFLLSQLRVKDDRILAALTRRFEAGDPEGALLLDMYGDPTALPVLEAALAALDPTNADVFKLKSFIQDLSSQSTHVEEQEEPFDLWQLYAETIAPPFEVLEDTDRIEMLRSGSSELKAEVAGFYRGHEFHQKVGACLLELAKTDPDLNVRGECWETLGEISNEPEIRRALLNVMSDASASLEERAGAVVALAPQTDNAKIFQAIENLYAEPRGRAKALKAMGRSFDKRFAAYPPRHLDDPDPAIRRQTIWAVGYLNLQSEALRLTAFFDDDEFRTDALFAYALSVPGETSPGRIRSLLNKIDEAAGGFRPEEEELVEIALDQRLILHGKNPVFSKEDEEVDDEESEIEPVIPAKVGRNDPCPCGSGKKYKKCCGA